MSIHHHSAFGSSNWNYQNQKNLHTKHFCDQLKTFEEIMSPINKKLIVALALVLAVACQVESCRRNRTEMARTTIANLLRLYPELISEMTTPDDNNKATPTNTPTNAPTPNQPTPPNNRPVPSNEPSNNPTSGGQPTGGDSGAEPAARR